MFRIQENLDGTTSIYCKTNGNLLCKIPTKGNSNFARPVNVVGPQPSNAKWQQAKNQIAYPINEKPTDQNDDSPIPSDVEESPKEEGGGTQEGFLRFLDLVPSGTFHSTPREELLAEWPLRKLARSKAFRYNCVDNTKIPDLLDLTSCYGVRLMKMGGERHFVQGDNKLQALLRSYDSYCRHPYNTGNGTSCHFPKLRCRGEKHFPVVTPPRVLRHQHTAHTYSRGRRQREERKRTLRTGLDARSRRLLRLFGSAPCEVRLTRLPQPEIDDWLSRRSPPSDSDDSDVEIIDEDPTYRPNRRMPALSVARTLRGKDDARNLPETRRCGVFLKNVVSDIRRRGNTHYYGTTNVKVPFYRDFLSSLRTNRPLLNRVYTANGGLDSAFQRHHLPTKPSTSFQDVFMAPSSKRSSGSNLVTGLKRTALRDVDSQKSQQKIVKITQRTQQTTIKVKQKIQPAVLVLDVDKNSSAIKQLMKSTNNVVAVRHPDSESDVDVIPLIDLTEDSPPRPPGGQITKIKQLVKSPGNSLAHQAVGLSVKSRQFATAGPSGHQARGQSVGGMSRRSSGHQTAGPSSQTAGPLSRTRGPSGLRAQTTRQEETVGNSRRPSGHQTAGPSSQAQARGSSVLKSQVGTRRSSSSNQVSLCPSLEQRSFVASQWKFRCFACGFQRLFFGQQEQPQAVEKAVRDHMHLFHYVTDAEAFLSRYWDSVNRCTVIEAFPGFKESED